MRRTPLHGLALFSLLGFVLSAACSSSDGEPDPNDPSHDGGDAPRPSEDGSAPGPDGSGSSSGVIDDDGGVRPTCSTRFHFVPPGGRAYSIVRVTGEWNQFSQDGPVLTRQPDGSFVGDVVLPQGRVGYKYFADGEWTDDSNAYYRKYIDGIDNPAVQVGDCTVPQLQAIDVQRNRSAQGQGRVVAKLRFAPSATESPLAQGSVRAVLRKDFADTPVAAQHVAVQDGDVTIDVGSLADGKYTLLVEASDQAGKASAPLRLIFWIEQEAFDWRDALIYMGMNDRVKNGDPSNDAPSIDGIDVRVQFQGGDLQGMRQLIDNGYLDELGVRAIWLSPFNTNPEGAYDGSAGQRVTGYHGYWPIRAREVDPRIGGEQALRDMVASAHAHGIRVLQDFVINHVHQEHEYVSQHPDWFRTGCVCGTNDCDWTSHRLECLFTSYLPDVNWSAPGLSEQMEADAAFWVREFDLDGLRVDAVKHVEDAAVVNLTSTLRAEFEPSGERLFLTGETAMGWNDCSEPNCPGNEENYGTISRYMGPRGLDGQFDFVLYHAAPLQVFAYENKSLYHADYWTQASLLSYPAGGVMTPYIGSHDTPRFTTFASYGNGDVPNRQWGEVATAPGDATAYERTRFALAWLFAQPGAPLLYYGDEYGQWGGADPNNRHFFRDASALNANESATLAWTKTLGTARRNLPALRRGHFALTAYADNGSDDVSVTTRRGDDGQVVVVVLSRSARTVNVVLPPGVTLPNGTQLRDRLSARTAVVNGNSFQIAMPRYGASYFAP